jgi:hypothetical protein
MPKKDRLAQGAKSETFYGPTVTDAVWNKGVNYSVPFASRPWGFCHDCPGVFMSAKEFSDHVRECDEIQQTL